MADPVRFRFAPSPTGKLHIGGARTALFNWAAARRLGGKFLLRVEDTDRERSTPEFEAAILEGLRWLGLEWDEGPDVGGEHGPYRQSERQEEHLGVAARLFQAGWAYRCFCSSERLEALREEQRAKKENPRYDGHCKEVDDAEAVRRIEAGERPVLRFKVPAGETEFEDLIRGRVRFDNREVDDWIMVRADGSPTYNFVVVCDDSHMKVTHVVRGEEHLTNTPKQILLYDALGLDRPQFAHLPLILGADKKKLSKRTGDTALSDYQEKGYPPEAVLNFLALQGWALDGETEVFTLEELCQNFDLKDVSKGGSIFDEQKFRWLAGETIRRQSVAQLAERGGPFLVAAGLLGEAELDQRRGWVEAACATVQERVELYSELPEKLAYLFAADDAVAYEEKALAKVQKGTDPKGTLGSYGEWLRPRLEGGVDADGLRAETKAWIGEQGLKMPALFQPLRVALTGALGGPDLFDVMALLGSEKTLRRIEAGLVRFG